MPRLIVVNGHHVEPEGRAPPGSFVKATEKKHCGLGEILDIALGIRGMEDLSSLELSPSPLSSAQRHLDSDALEFNHEFP